MAYYDSFTKKPRKKSEDWRDDAYTMRPARDGVEDRKKDARPPRREMNERGPAPRREYGDRPPRREMNERGPAPRRDYGEHPPRREMGERGPAPRRDYGDRPPRREMNERDSAPRRDYGEHPPRREMNERGPAPRRDYGECPPRREMNERGPAPRRDFDDRRMPAEREGDELLLVGRNPIREALRANRDLEKLLVAKGELIGSAREIVAMAREQKVIVQEVDRARLDAMAPSHQGLIAVASAYSYKTVDDMLALARERGEAPFLVILDGVTDPHNVGAIIRSAECAGAHGVILPERRACGLTSAAVKASAGAVEHIPVAREVNLTRLIERLKRENIWIYGAAMAGEDYRGVNFEGPAALVIGSEGDGMSRLVAESCDALVSLPMKGRIDSLNASVAAGILLYAISAARD